MESYKLGDISNLLNSASTPETTSDDLFSNNKTVAVEEVYAKPVPVSNKRPKKTKSIEPEAETEQESKFKKLSPEEQLEINKRTLFVGNLPVGLKRKQLRKLFAEFGKIESLRFRSVAISDLKLGKKVCLKSNKINENATNKNGYIVYVDEACLEQALSKNGLILNDHCIRVDKVVKSKEEMNDDSKNSVFIGNIPFSAQEDDIRSALLQCGDIEYVRLLRDPKTNIGKGFGYVKFSDSAGVMLAMKVKDTVEIEGRKLRIQKCKSKMSLSHIKKAKEEKAKKKEEKEASFRGRKSKRSDKDIITHKARSGSKKAGFDKRPKGPNKEISRKKFDRKVNKVSKKGPNPGTKPKGKKKT